MDLDLDKAKMLASFERKILRTIFGSTKVGEIWRKKYNKELENIFGDLDFISFIRISRLKWIGHLNRMHADRLPKSIFNNQLKQNRLIDRRNWWNCVQADLKKYKIFD